jgi:pimeloyl-ACP methyl ester carboxylesterase
MTDHHPFRSEAARQRFLALYDYRAAQWPVDSETRMVSTTQGTTLVRVSGPPDAQPVVLVHGIGGNSLQWMANVEALSAELRVFAVDAIYDYGRSVYTRPLDGVDDYVLWLDELLTELQPGGAVDLVGLSYGGWLASQYALRHPERVRRLVLIAPVGTVLPLRAEWIARAVLCALPHPYFTKRFLRWLAADLNARDEHFVEEWASEAYLAERSFKRRRIAHPTVLSDEEWTRLRMPTLFLVGENERIYSAPDAVDRLRAVAPQVTTALVAGAGHDLTMVQSEQINRSIRAFLESPGTLDPATHDLPRIHTDEERDR